MNTENVKRGVQGKCDNLTSSTFNWLQELQQVVHVKLTCVCTTGVETHLLYGCSFLKQEDSR